MRLLVCDDDGTLRSVLRGLASSAGHEVVAEADSVLDAEVALDRVVIDALVVDLSLRFGSGREVLRLAVRRGLPAVVFTSFGDDAEAAELPGRPRVVRKPDFEELERALAGLAPAAPEGIDRRARAPRTDPIRPMAVVDEPYAFYDVLSRGTSGDVLVRVEVVGGDAGSARAALATTRHVVRAQDRIMCAGTAVVVLLMAGDAGAGDAVRNRLERAWADRGAAGVLAVHTTTILATELPVDAFERLRQAALVLP